MYRSDIKLVASLASLASLSLLLVFSCSAPSDPADTESPEVNLTNPVAGTVASNAIDVCADATDNVEVSKVEFYVDGEIYSSDESAPWACYWTATVDQAGEHVFAARAFDAAGNSRMSATVTVNCAITPPGQVTDLAASQPDFNGDLTLTWTSPGDDGNTGTAAAYDIRYYWTTITDENWASAAPFTGAPTPQVAGSSESFDLTSLRRSTTYYFALRAKDALGNISAISNCVSVRTMDLFGDQVTIPACAGANFMTIADLDSDGNEDFLFTLGTATYNVQAMYGNGDGTFEAPTTYSGRINTTSAGSGDFDHDGDEDLIVSNYNIGNTVVIDITCYPDTSWDIIYDAEGNIISMTVDEIVKVCDTLLAVNVSLMTLMYNEGNRVIEWPGVQYGFYDTSYYWCNRPLYYVYPDSSYICIGCYANLYQTIPRYEPFWPPCPTFNLYDYDSTILEYRAGRGPVSTAVADFNNDGWLDFAAANQGGSSITVSLNKADGSGGFINPRDSLAAAGGLRSVLAADMNGDGYQDLLAVCSSLSQVIPYYNTGTGRFTRRSPITVPAVPTGGALADYDGDGDLDIIVSTRTNGVVGIVRNLGGGVFATTAGRYDAGRGPSAVATADFDGDGMLDIAVPNEWGNDVSILLNQGQFMYYSFNTVNFDVGVAPVRIACRDFDKDGDVDVAVYNRGSADISILFNQMIR